MLFREKSWPIAPGEESSGLALDNDTHRLFSVCSNKLMVIVDALDGHVVTTLPVGDGCDGILTIISGDPCLKFKKEATFRKKTDEKGRLR